MPPEPPDQKRVSRVLPADRRRVGPAAGDHLPLRLREVRRHPAPRRSVPARRQGRADHRKRLRLPRPPNREPARRPVRDQCARAAGGFFSRGFLAGRKKEPEGRIELLCSKYVLAVPLQRLCIGPERSLSRTYDTASFETRSYLINGKILSDCSSMEVLIESYRRAVGGLGAADPHSCPSSGRQRSSLARPKGRPKRHPLGVAYRRSLAR